MLRLWPDPQLTPKPTHHEKNPFADYVSVNSGPQTPTAVHPLLSPALFSPACSVISDLTPPPASPFGAFASAQPTTHLSIHAPIFKMQQPPPGKNTSATSSHSNSSSSSSSSSAPPLTPTTSPQSATSRGQIHVKLIQARALTVRSIHARPYCVVQFEQNEFVSRDPIPETDKEVKGKPVILSRQTSSNAISALDAIGSKAAAQDAKRKNSKGSKEPSPSSSLITAASKALSLSPQHQPPPPAPSSGIANGLFGRLSPNNPAWKHEVSFDVTSEEELITVNVYDRAVSDQGFLGTVQIKPVLIHDHTVDQWYKLRPFEDEVVSGEIRIQITYEAYKSFTSGVNGHTPNGPLGSERPKSASPLGTITNGNGTSMAGYGGVSAGMSNVYSNGGSTPGSGVPRAQGIQIKKPKRSTDVANTPLTNSVQENFRGFTYHGRESVVAPMGVGRRDLAAEKEAQRQLEEAVDDEEAPEVTTEDEFEDVGRSAGRYANSRRNGRAATFDDDDVMS
ncbi:hypothetical protein CVT25_011139 [Psilocybe cyanescens]|uniref:C2 domain-containing protein n=1 Tax=Psilocybe cyanescens TaxID=93625 RepID=A0A409WGP4_PSICY|nr:hypothetical protein CVT25_011139 [Psilocybe cyanescens]